MKKQTKKSQVKRLEISEVNELITKVKQARFEEEKLELLFKDEMDIYAFILGVTKLAEDKQFEEQRELWAIVYDVINTIGFYHLNQPYLEYEDILEVFDVLERGSWYANTECWLIDVMLQVRHNDNLSNDNILEIFNKLAHLLETSLKERLIQLRLKDNIIKSLLLAMKHYINYLTFNNVNKTILKYTLKTMITAMSNKNFIAFDEGELFAHTVLRQYLLLLGDIFKYHCKLNKFYVWDGIVDVSSAISEYNKKDLPYSVKTSSLEVINRMLTLDELQEIFNELLVMCKLHYRRSDCKEYFYHLQNCITLAKFEME